MRSSENKSFGNDVYRVTYELDDLDTVPLFGAKYNFHLEGVVDCPEFLVYFPMLEKYEKLLVLLKYQIVQCTSKLSYVLNKVFLFEIVLRLAEDYGMKLLYRKSFAEFFSENAEKGEYRGLLNRMQGLEVRKRQLVIS